MKCCPRLLFDPGWVKPGEENPPKSLAARGKSLKKTLPQLPDLSWAGGCGFQVEALVLASPSMKKGYFLD